MSHFDSDITVGNETLARGEAAVSRSVALAFPLQVFLVAAVSAVATLAFGSVLSSWWFLTSSAVGAAAAAIATIAARRFELLFGEMAAAAAVLLVLVGPAAVGGFSEFYRGIIFSWTDILSATPPIDLTPIVRTAPFLTAFGAALIGGQLLRGSRFTSLAIAGPLVGVAVSAMFALGADAVSRASGAVVVGGLLALAFLQRTFVDELGDEPDTAGIGPTFSPSRAALAALLLAMVTSGALWLGPRLPLADSAERLDLRELQTPPWDPLALPSPLTTLKASLKSDATVPLFRVEGDTPELRWKAAVLPSFTGVYWSVAGASGEADFVPVDSRMPKIPGYVDLGDTMTWTVTPTSDLGWWIPVAGTPTQIDFTEAADVRMSLNTGTLGAPSGLSIGDRYVLTSSATPAITDDEFGNEVLVTAGADGELTLVPPSVRNLAADFSTGMPQRSGRRVLAVRDNLQQGSYDLEAAPGHAYGRMAEFLSAIETTNTAAGSQFELRPLQGYEELYASSAALLVELSDIDARVVTGWIIPPERWVDGGAEIFASDANAWIEVLVPAVGWVPVDVTPQRTNEPLDTPPGAEEIAVPISEPPKEPPPPEDAERPEINDTEEEPEAEEDDEDDEEANDAAVPVVAVAAGAIAIPVVLALMAIGAVIAAKARRRRKRASAGGAESVLGAWQEVEDRFLELGHPATPDQSPLEATEQWTTHEELPGDRLDQPLRVLSAAVSRANFHPDPPSEQVSAQAWASYDVIVETLDEELSAFDKFRVRTDPRPLVDSSKGRA